MVSFSFSGSGEAFKWMPELESPCIYLRRYAEVLSNMQHVFGGKISMCNRMHGDGNPMF